MRKPTPGPWEAFTEERFSGWWAIRQITQDGETYEVGSTDGGFKEADARLMAAAPNLLEAVEAFLKYDADSEEDMMVIMEQYAEALRLAKEAVAKVRGEVI